MKTNIIIPIVTALILSGCSSSYYASSGYDDIYYVPGKAVVSTESHEKTYVKQDDNLTDYERYREAVDKDESADTLANPYAQQNYQRSNTNSDSQPVVSASNSYSQPDEYVDKNGNTYIINNDYGYSSSLRRYDNYYGGYYYDPFWYSSGWSVGIGCGWGYPSFGYYSSYYSGWGFGIGFNWGYPYYGNYYAGNYYGNAYWDGYYAGSISSGSYVIPERNSKYRGINGRSTSSAVYNRTIPGSSGYSASSGVSSGNINPNAESSRSRYTRAYTSSDSYKPTYNRTSGTNYTRTTAENVSDASSARTYTPSYSKPRTYSRTTYNDGSYTRSSSSPVVGNTSNYTRSTSSGYSSSSTSSSYSGGTTSGSYSSGSSSAGSSRSSSSGSSGGGSSHSYSSGGRR